MVKTCTPIYVYKSHYYRIRTQYKKMLIVFLHVKQKSKSGDQEKIYLYFTVFLLFYI